MKNKFQKNNEKNVDQSTRSRSIKSRWAVILLVLLVMITMILASFVVPASAADPFYGSGRISISDLKFFQFGDTNFSNPIPLKRLDVSPIIYANVSFNNKILSIDLHHFSSAALYFEYQNVTFSDIPFSSCDRDVEFVGFNTNNYVVVPAHFNIQDYIAQYKPELLDAQFSRVNFTSTSNVWNFTMRDGYYSVEVEGGIQSVFDLIVSWLSNTFTTLGGVFFDNGSLTVLGGLAIGSLGVSVILLLIKVISNFIRFRG